MTREVSILYSMTSKIIVKNSILKFFRNLKISTVRIIKILKDSSKAVVKIFNI